MFKSNVISPVEKYLCHSVHSQILSHWLLDYVLADETAAINQIATSLEVICFVFLVPLKASICIWSLKLCYDASIVYFKCYATQNLLGFLNMWIFVFITFDCSVIISSNIAFSPFSFPSPPGTLHRYMWELLCLPCFLSYFLVLLGCIFYNMFRSIFHPLVLPKLGLIYSLKLHFNSIFQLKRVLFDYSSMFLIFTHFNIFFL